MALRGASISELHGLGEKTMQRLREKGIETVEQLAQMTPDDLTQIPGIGEKTVEKIRRVVTDYFEQDREPAAEAAPVVEAESATADEPPGEHPATLDEVPEEEPSASAVSGQPEAAELPVAEHTEPHEDAAPAEGEREKEE
jgi:N utilization substance protein A